MFLGKWFLLRMTQIINRERAYQLSCLNPREDEKDTPPLIRSFHSASTNISVFRFYRISLIIHAKDTAIIKIILMKITE